MKFHHIGIATENIEKMIEKLSNYFSIKEISDKVYDMNQEDYLCMITLEDDVKVELISGKIVENMIKKKQYLYHTCYTVNSIENTIDQLVNDGAFLVREPREAILFENKREAFLMWDLGLIELLEGGN